MTDRENDDEMICGLTADERDALRAGLHQLPQTGPPRIVWDRILDQAEAEGLIRRRGPQHLSGWLGGAGLAATVALAVLILPRIDESPVESRTEPLVTEQTNQVPLTALQALMVQSSQLESDLRSLPDEPHVVRAGTVATLSEIEDRIAAIDFQLNNTAQPLTADEQELFWRERVRLMKSLVQLRYAQAQRTSF